MGSVVARGDADLGVQQVSELLPVTGIEIAGQLPSELRTDIIYSASALTGQRNKESARALAEFLKSPTVIPVLRKYGFTPF